ncbi:glycosyltransferase [Microbacterium hatanonis]|uniref:Glycosyltransferase family 2 protein n=1 Tax=Microbacterium hatanonis TaxID=404366 RepID=A0A5C8I289_9MICO|nr:glycosyltransferase family 2 protein [Microbacterium hatanonis]TXK13188.1 glycosyltransferase family 2 protein [Microbacterium hatanonis]
MDAVWITVVVVAIVGLSTVIWSVSGLARLVAAASSRPLHPRPHAFHPSDVAVIIAAHNEQLVIEDTIRNASGLVTIDHVFVVSDGSTDETVLRARTCGASVLEVAPNRGKAGAIALGIDEFRIAERFDVLVLLDADTRLRPDYLSTGLPLFDDTGVVAVAGRATSHPRAGGSWVARLLTTYRERTYVCTQYLQKFGQAARCINAVTIVPGFASMYRTAILGDIDIVARGLSIEDFNMTFEVHRKRLGRIAFHPGKAIAETQDPVVLGDYARQMKRWSLGFWQTVRRHGLHPGLFWSSLALFVTEVLVSSVVLALILPVLAVAAVALALSGLPDPVGATARDVSGVIPLAVLAAGFVISDVMLTLVAAALTRRRPSPSAVLFPFLRVLDAWMCLLGLAAAFGHPSDGRWRSPERRDMADGAENAGATAAAAAVTR